MKYIITNLGDVVIGTLGMYHADLAKSANGDVIAAGHVDVRDGRVVVYGSSTGYNMQARPEDAIKIARVLGIRN